MISIILKYTFIFFFTIYICLKSLPMFKLSKTTNIIISLTLAIISYLLSTLSDGIYYIFPLLLLWLIISILNLNPQLSFIAVTISFAISFCLHSIASFIIIFFSIPITNASNTLPFLALLSGLLQYLLTKLLLSTKRFKKGIPFTSSLSIINIATILCLLFIMFTLFISIDYKLIHIKVFGLSLFIMTLAFLIYWWQAQITKSYRRALELREQESKRIADLEKDVLIQKLLKENERLATMSHRDNTLITTLKNATVNYLVTDFKVPEEARKIRDELIANIEALSAGRASLPENYNEKQAQDFATGFSLLDKMLHQMDEDAIKMNITFSVHFGVMLGEFVPQDISEMDLVHLVDDLLKNAFKATRNSDPRMVQLQFYKAGKYFVVEVADSGIPFEVESLVLLGMEKRTTYADGSGIGLMDIWNTKEKCRATYHIEEYDTPAPFTKKISLTFDGKNRYSIRTSRKDEILQMSKRVDLQVYGYEE